MKFLLFSIQDQYYAIELTFVKRVIWSVAITSLSQKGPAYMTGVINVHGEIMPVINVRHLLHKSTVELNLNDKFIISQFENQSLVLWVDKVHELKDYSEDQFSSESCTLPYVIKDEDKIIYVYQWEKLFKMEAQE